MSRIPDRIDILRLRLRHPLERNQLAEQFLKIVDEQLTPRGYMRIMKAVQ